MPERAPIFLTPSNAKLIEGLWNDHSGAVHAMLLAYCGNPDDAGDIVQDLFLRLSRDPSPLATMKSPRAFLIVSARRLAIDLARKRTAELRRQESPEAADHFHPAPSAPLADKDLWNIIKSALQKLPSDQRSVTEAKLIHGKTLSVIANEQGIPLNTVASRLRYSLDKLRNELRPHYEHMKNPNALSSERLIKTLEPKRVPSVAPGLEGVAACAVFDHVDEAPVDAPCVEWDDAETPEPEIFVLPPEDHSLETTDHTDPEPEILYCGFEGGSLWIQQPPTEDPSGEFAGDHSDPEIVLTSLFEGGGDESNEHSDLSIFDSDHVKIDPPWPFERAFSVGESHHLVVGGVQFESNYALSPTGESHFDGQTVVTGGTLVVNAPITAQVQIEEGGHLSVAEKTFSEGSYEFSNSILPVASGDGSDSHPQVSPAPEVKVSESHAARTSGLENSVAMEFHDGQPTNVSASNSPIESLASSPSSHVASPQPALIAESDLPPIVTSVHINTTHADEAMDDIVFVEEASDARHDHLDVADTGDVATPIATPAASAALTGAFVLGSSAQVPSVKGYSSRLAKPL